MKYNIKTLALVLRPGSCELWDAEECCLELSLFFCRALVYCKGACQGMIVKIRDLGAKHRI